MTDKMLYNVFHLGLISLLFPQSRIIHCTRDSLDTCISNYFQNYGGYNGFASDLKTTGHFITQFKRLMKHWENVLENPVLTVNYENLVANQEQVTKEIVEFCGLEWNSACLSFHKNSRLVNTASINQINQPMYSTSVTRWRNYEAHLDELKDVLNAS